MVGIKETNVHFKLRVSLYIVSNVLPQESINENSMYAYYVTQVQPLANKSSPKVKDPYVN